jgi:hypothetical protein
MGQPLDSKDAFFYGQFVQAAYSMFQNPQSADPLKPEPQGIPEGWELAAWIHMSDFILKITTPKFYGIVARNVDNPTLRILAIRGTESAVEWVDDGAAILVPFKQVPSAGKVAYGFDKIYSTLTVVKYSKPGTTAVAVSDAPETYSGSFAEQLEQLAKSHEAEIGLVRAMAPAATRPPRPTVVTGHSLGSALATLFVMENDDKKKFDLTTACTFASPRVGNLEFVGLFNKLPINSWRIVNTRDLVPKLPFHIPVLADFDHVDVAYPFDSGGFAKNNAVCWHSMETYLHWLDTSSPVLPECVP